MSEEELIDKVNEYDKLKELYEKIYNENCVLRENHNINDISLLDKLYKYKEVLDKIKEYRKWLDENTVIYNSGECVKLNGTYWEAEGIKIILDKILEEIE